MVSKIIELPEEIVGRIVSRPNDKGSSSYYLHCITHVDDDGFLENAFIENARI
jgi:hypothetical protein